MGRWSEVRNYPASWKLSPLSWHIEEMINWKCLNKSASQRTHTGNNQSEIFNFLRDNISE
jgi:hypothetical protein